jgi:hypothetical protein
MERDWAQMGFEFKSSLRLIVLVYFGEDIQPQFQGQGLGL